MGYTGVQSAVLAKPLEIFDKKVSDALIALWPRVSITATCAAVALMADHIDQVGLTSSPPVRSQTEAECTTNVVMSGVADDRDRLDWRRKVDDVLQYIAARSTGHSLGHKATAKFHGSS